MCGPVGAGGPPPHGPAPPPPPAHPALPPPPAPGAPAAPGAPPPPGPPPRGGAVSALAIVWLSSTLAMNTPALFCSIPAPYPQCSCQISSSPGEVRIVGIACVPAPLRVPFCITATRGCSACTSCGEPEGSVPWCDTM